MSEVNKIYNVDVRKGLLLLDNESVNCCVTSPPYFGLRDYRMDDQMGIESHPDEYVSNMVSVFREVRRVLKNDGTLWLNIGDSYNGTGLKTKQTENSPKQKTSKGAISQSSKHIKGEYKPKDLLGIPWMLAFALRADGWYLRQDIIWNKPNPMPESVGDRCTKSHEYIFMLSKSKRYYYDAEAIKEDTTSDSIKHFVDNTDKQRGHSRRHAGFNGRYAETLRQNGVPDKRNKRSVWTIAPAQFPDSHFATFPEEIPAICIKAGCPKGGLVLDPFMGSGTTAVVARKLQRNYIGFELNPEYVRIIENRLLNELGMFQ